ncbi:MAG: DUF2270 domain-containing protein [Deltaproteobacteria bacterium]|nr:DUF2270 domain-containing protein [Deltaproteobacteria bacterium]
MSRPEDPGASDALEAAAGSGGAFHTAMAHLYRGEIHRMTVWRSRLDATSHWAMLLTVGMTTFTLGASGVPHFILLLGLALNTMCMLIEARRYQHLHRSEWRLGLLERGYFAPLLASPAPEPDWRERLAADLRRPCVDLGLFAAVRIRLRRNYLMLLLFVTAVWVTKVFIHPVSARSVGEFYSRLAVADVIPSWFVAASACVFVLVSTALALAHRPDALARCPTELPP